MTYSLPIRLLTGAVLACAAVSPALAITRFGTDEELFVTARAAVQYNDNLLLSNTGEISDTILELDPGLAVTFGQNALNQGTFAIDENFKVYSDHDSLNTQLFHGLFVSRFDDGVTKVDVDLHYQQLDQATRDARGPVLAKRDIAHAGVLVENSLTEKTSIKGGVIYDDTNYKPVTYVDWQYFQVPINYYYKVLPKLDIGAGFQYQDNQMGKGGTDSKTYFYNVGGRGEIAPKLTGEFYVGLSQNKLDVGPTQNTVGVHANFTYAATAKTNVLFGATNDYGYSGAGDPYRESGLNAGFDAKISEQVTITGRAYYYHYSYTTTGQRDDYTQGQIGVTYLIKQDFTVTGAYSIADDNSNLPTASFTNNILSVSASYRF